RRARDWIVGLTGAVLIIVGVTAHSVRDVQGYGLFGIVLGVTALATWMIAIACSQTIAGRAALAKEDQAEAIAGIEASKEEFGHDVIPNASSDASARSIIELVKSE